MDIKELEKEFYGKFVCTDIQQPEFAVSPDRVWEWIEEKVSRVELPVKPACETDKTQCKFCTRETTAEDFGFGKDRVCKSCLEKALANELRNMEQ